MARILSILLIFIYSFSATGATVHLHYCCGKLQHPASHAEKQDPGDCPLCLKHDEKQKDNRTCGDDNSCKTDGTTHGHCKNIKLEAKKTTEEHLPSGHQTAAKIYPLELLVITLAHLIPAPLDIGHAPHLVATGLQEASIPLFIQHCTYRI
ncbi:hypothetical protein [Parapedobacter sp. DT-150]|uniref:hypothetical protein n=1 Tax=Parapedobacter sp. DT-150 TaxID=3396162 RepID=UPI003F1AE3B6